MRVCLLIAALLFLTSCVPEYQAQETPTMPAREMVREEQVLVPQQAEPPALFTKVFQKRGNETILWGYDKQGRLLLINSSEKTVLFSYADGRLVRIDDGEKPLSFEYDDNGLLVFAVRGLKKWVFVHDSKGRLVSLNDGEKLSVSYDSKGRLSSVARDKGLSIEFFYGKNNRTKSFFRGGVETSMVYDSDGRLTRLDRGDDHLVMAYWRYDLLSSLSGTMYGLKETVNYGPTSITLVSNVGQNVFESKYADEEKARLNAFNTFLFCTRFRKIPVLFDGQSWVMYHEYMKGNITDYLFTSFTCEFLP